MRKRKYTEEEIAARELRKTRVRELAKQVSALSPEARVELANRAGIRTIEGRELSTHNACLLIYQKPDVSLVGGFHQWRKAGRIVSSGKGSGLSIWVPTGAKDDNGEIQERTGFIGATVFDISQTRPIEEDKGTASYPPAPSHGDPPNWEETGRAIIAAAEQFPSTVITCEGTYKGRLNPDNTLQLQLESES